MGLDLCQMWPAGRILPSELGGPRRRKWRAIDSDFLTEGEAAGCYDGTVMVFDIRHKDNKPIYQSTVRTAKHTDPVWQVRW